MRIAGVIKNSPWPVPSCLTPQTQSQLFLHLGYEDRDGQYGDNGYWGHDDGNPTQCAGIGPAWVEITVVSGPPSGQQTYFQARKTLISSGTSVWGKMCSVEWRRMVYR